ncbi:MAG: hypothetical protein A2Y17_06420 [Clostridiales bacterium GWF2_38_85]|nr:MAG: hypothetical protein A2Y17_06420 [Clostridiales bacterium GWF2_38_85]
MDKNFIAKHWYASVYEQFENQTNDVEFLLNVLAQQTNGTIQNILEVACGGGRISIPLAKAGYNVTGFDLDEYMLIRCYNHIKDLQNLRCYKADAINEDWGKEYDVVVIAGNFLINIESECDYAEAQALIIGKAAKALKKGGHLYLDFDLHFDPAAVFNCLRESNYFHGTDELGTTGKTVSYGSVYDPVTQICAGANHLELKTNNGESIICSKRWYKHIPTQAQIYDWIQKSGFSIEKTYENYTDNPVPQPIAQSTHRVTIWAVKI